MIPEVPRLFGAAQDEGRHAALAETGAILAALEQFGGNADAMIRAGVVAFSHLYDGFAAAAWIREAARLDADTISLMSPEAQRAEVERIWRAFGNYWRCLNVSPYAWKPLRWAFEDALGYYLSSQDRGRQVGGATEWGDPTTRPQTGIEETEHFNGLVVRRAERVSDGQMSFERLAPCWRVGSGVSHMEGDLEVVTGSPDDGCRPGAWRRDLMTRWRLGRRATEVRFGFESDFGDLPGQFPIGVPTGVLRGAPSGEAHRYWLYNDGTVLVHQVAQTPSAFGINPSAGWNEDASFTASQLVGYFLYAVAPTRFYFDLLRAPRPGLKAFPGGPDLSLVDYLAASSPEEIIREVRRDVMVRNNLMKHHRRIYTDAQLYTAAQLEDQQRRQRAAEDVTGEAQDRQRSASAVMTGVNTIARAIGPEAGALAGVGTFIYQVGEALASRVAVSERRIDIFGRLMPTFERFEITDGRTVLVDTVRAVELPPGTAPDPEATRARNAARAREIERVIAALNVSSDPGAVLLDPSLLRRGRRTVVLVGLDPAQGARVYGTTPRERYETLPDGTRRTWAEAAPELTTGQPEYGGGAQWTTADGVPVWRFGVAEGVLEIRVVYPDGRERTIALDPPDPEGTPDARTAVVDAAPESEAESGRAGFPARTAVLVGLDPSATPAVFAGTRMVGLDPAPTGDAARWIDSTVPGVRGWMFGVPAGARELRVLDAQGARVFPLAPLGVDLPARDRVTVIDASRAAVQPLTAATTSKAPLVLGGLVALGLGALVLSRRSR